MNNSVPAQVVSKYLGRDVTDCEIKDGEYSFTIEGNMDITLRDLNLSEEVTYNIEDTICQLNPYDGYFRISRLPPDVNRALSLPPALKLSYNRVVAWTAFLLKMLYPKNSEHLTKVQDDVPYSKESFMQILDRVGSSNDRMVFEGVFRFLKKNSNQSIDLESGMITECIDYFTSKRTQFTARIRPEVAEVIRNLIADANATLEQNMSPTDVTSLLWYLVHAVFIEFSRGLAHAIFGLKILTAILADLQCLENNAEILITTLTNSLVNICHNQDFRKMRDEAKTLKESRKYAGWLTENHLYKLYSLLRDEKGRADAIKLLSLDTTLLRGKLFKLFCLGEVDTKLFYSMSIAALLHKMRLLKHASGLTIKSCQIHPKGSSRRIWEQFQVFEEFLNKFDDYVTNACGLKPGCYLTCEQVQFFLNVQETLILKIMKVLTTTDNTDTE